MNCNPHMPFSEQDYHLLKTHQSSSDSGSEIITITNNVLEFDNKHNYNFDII